jgi:hypothetical protein
VSPELIAFAGAFAGGAAAGIASAAVRWLRLDSHLAEVAAKATTTALAAHEEKCPWRDVAARHVAEPLLSTPSGRWPITRSD